MSSPQEPLLETAMTALLGQVSEATGGVFAQFAPQTARAPYLIFQRISADRVKSTEGPSGLAQVRTQIDAYASSYLTVKQLAAAVRRLLDGYRGTVDGVRIGGSSLLSDTDLFDDGTDPKLHRVSMDFLITHDET